MAETRKSLLLSLFVVGLLAALVILPYQFRSEAGSQGKNKGLNPRTESHDEGLPNYDIREAKETEAGDALVKFRQSAGKDASAVATSREGFVRGEEELKSRVPSLEIVYNTDIRTPEVIGPDVKQGRNFLTGATTGIRAEVLRNFVKENNSLIGVSDAQADDLKVTADYKNPEGELSFAHLEQRINGIPIFRSEVKAGFTKNGEMIRVINNLAPGLDYGSLSNDFRNPADAVKAAARHINHNLKTTERNEAVSSDLKSVFGQGDWATTAEKMYFPTEPGVAIAAWRVLIWEPVSAYYVIVDAESGTMLWRKNITEDQTQAATYNVYTNSNAMINSADSPAPLTPGPISPTLGTQGAIIPNRTNVTRIGNEAPYTFNNNGWITDGANITDGNYNESGVDLVAPNGVDAPVTGSPSRTFTTSPAWNPPPGNPAPGDAPSTQQARDGAVIQMFYVMNLYQSEMYRLGFTEQAFNFQNDNFGRGGAAADRVSAEGQDSSGTNNANFSTPADGGRGRMQMFVWTGPTPDYDGTADADVIIHEVTHGLSNRLHGNSAGLSTNMARGMGEGWSDFYGHAMLSEPTDPANGIYTTGGYATFQLISATDTSNYYYGIRRYPKAPIAFTGGPNNKPHNAYRFSDINADCAARFTNANFAFARGPVGAAQCDAVHNIGEIWSSALWEVRTKMVARLGWAVGNRKALQLVTDGMKLAPTAPTLLTERNAIISAAQASADPNLAAADVADVWSGFALRGMGFSASIQSISPAAVTDAFDLPALGANSPAITSGNNLLEPNECNTLNIPVTNNGADAATGITGVLTSNTPGITIAQATSAYPNTAAGASSTNTTPYQVSVDPSVACFTSASFTLTTSYTGGGGGAPNVFNFTMPVGIQGLNYAFVSTTGTIPAGGTFIPLSDDDDFAVTVPLPASWTSTIYGTPVTSLSANTNGTLTANVSAGTAFTNTALPGTTLPAGPTLTPYWDDLDMDVADVTGGGIFVNTVGSAPNRQLYVEWKAQHFSETANGPITTNFAVLLTEGSDVVRFIYASTGIAAQLNGASATVGAQATNSGTQFTQFSFNTASLSAGLQLTGTRPAGQCTPGTGTCSVAPTGDVRADFDGDGRTDLSVFRPSDGNWYQLRSTGGFRATNWGIASDVIVPGDYDNDNKTDTAVFRGGNWLILNSSNNTFVSAAWGLSSDTPVAGDYDNDSKTDTAVFRSSNSTWYINKSAGGTQFTTWGQAGDVPIVGDFDGDGKADTTVYRAGQWLINKSTGGTQFTNWGQAGDLLVPADYDGDNKDDLAVFRPSNGTWYALRSTNGQPLFITFGQNGDVPVPGDYDGDGKDDQAVYRSGTWFLNRSTAGFSAQAFGLGSDRAVPKSYIP